MVSDVDPIHNQRRQQKQKLFDSMTKTEDGKELDLRERVARLKRYVARPKIYSRINKPRVRADHSFECSWPGCEAVFKVWRLTFTSIQVNNCLNSGKSRFENSFGVQTYGGKALPMRLVCLSLRSFNVNSLMVLSFRPGCDKQFPVKRNLARHRETHEGVKHYACDWPGCKAFFI